MGIYFILFITLVVAFVAFGVCILNMLFSGEEDDDD